MRRRSILGMGIPYDTFCKVIDSWHTCAEVMTPLKLVVALPPPITIFPFGGMNEEPGLYAHSGVPFANKEIVLSEATSNVKRIG